MPKRKAFFRLGYALAFSASITAVASPVVAQSPAAMPMVSINDFIVMHNDAKLGFKPSLDAMFYYFFGLRVALVALDDAHVANGAKRRLCIPPAVAMFDLIDATYDELARNAAHWNSRKSESLAPLAMQAFMRKWPCR